MRGYIALISVLIISAVLILIAVSIVQLGIGGTKMAIQENQSLESDYVAQACAEEALIKLVESATYSGNEIITINGNTCQILPLEGSGSNKVIKISTMTHNQTKRLKIETNQLRPTIGIASWQEVSSF